jgi:hypothetical protein
MIFPVVCRFAKLPCGLSKTVEEAVYVFLFFLNGIESEITKGSSDGFSITFFCSSSKRLQSQLIYFFSVFNISHYSKTTRKQLCRVLLCSK